MECSNRSITPDTAHTVQRTQRPFLRGCKPAEKAPTTKKRKTMSNEAQPITREAFALALKDLSVPIIYGKVSEIRNSLAHLQRSNGEMQAYIDEGIEGKEELEEAIAENAIVAERMQTRIELCRMELERRGAKWVDDVIREEAKLTSSMSDGAAAEGTGAAAGTREEERPTSRQPAAAAHGEAADGEEGVYL